MSDKSAIKFIQSLEKMLLDSKGQQLVFFVVGRAGWGKSSTVNSLVGQYVCEVNDYEPQTTDVSGHEFTINDVKATIFDTPGLCDGRGMDKTYIEMIRSKITAPDSMWYVSRLDETRVTEDERRGIKIISEALGSRVWENAIIVFTFANKVSASEYSDQLKKRTQRIQQAIADCIEDAIVAYQIPAVAIDNKSTTTPDGQEWLGELFTVVVDRVSKKGTVLLLSMLTDSIMGRTSLNGRQKGIIRKKFVASVFNSTSAAMGIGVVIAGFLSTPLIIGFSGGGILGTLLGAWLSQSDD